MKKTLTIAVALATMVVGLGTGLAQPPAGDSISSAVPAVGGPISGAEKGRKVALMTTTAPLVEIVVIPVLIPAQQDPDFVPLAPVMVANYLAGVSTETGWGLAHGLITSSNLTAGPSNGWWVVQQLIDIRSVDGEDSIDLAGIQVRSTSSPSSVLNSVYLVGTRGYGPAAVGVRKDGTLVVSGESTQKVARVVFITQMALFTGSIGEVKQWLSGQGNFTIKYEVRYGTSSYVGRAVVRLYGYELSSPRLIISRHENHFEFEVVGGDSHRPFYLQSSVAVTGTYQTIGRPVYPGDKLSLENPGSRNQFYRLVDTGW